MKEIKSVIESLGTYVPKQSISSKNLSKRLKNNTLWKEELLPLEKMTGIINRRVVSINETSYDLAKKAVINCLKISRLIPEDIDIIISCNISKLDHQNLFQIAPSYAIQLKKDFGFINAVTFDLNNACAGSFTGIHILDSFIKSGKFNNGIIVSGEYISHLTETALKEIDYQNDERLACLTLGDAGVACILERSELNNEGFIDHNIFTETGSQFCIANPTNKSHGGAIMYTNSRGIYNSTCFNGAISARHLLKKNKLSFNNDIDHIIMHQVSESGYRNYLENTNNYNDGDNITESIFIKNVSEFGNTASTSHLLALDTFLKNGKIKVNQTLLFAIQASGTTVGTFLYKLKNKPTDNKKSKRPVYPKRQEFNKETPKIKIRHISVSQSSKEIKQILTALKKSTKNINKTNIRSLIYTGMLKPNYICEPSYGSIISDAAELNKGLDFFSFDIANYGLGWLNACMVLNERPRHINNDLNLIITSETENSMHYIDVETKLIESSTSTLICQSMDNSGFSHFTFNDYPKYIDDYKLVISCTGEQTHFSCQETKEYQNNLIKCIKESVIKFMSLHDKTLEDFDYVLAPQLSKKFSSNLSKSLNSNKIVAHNIKGDFLSSGIPYGLHYLLDKSTKNEKALIISFSPGIQIGLAIYTF